jgi:hypothetical protein
MKNRDITTYVVVFGGIFFGGCSPKQDFEASQPFNPAVMSRYQRNPYKFPKNLSPMNAERETPQHGKVCDSGIKK